MTLWKVLPDKTTSFFVGTSLTGRIGICEVDACIKDLGDPLMIRKLFTNVGSDGMNKIFWGFQKLNRRISDILSCPVFHPFEQCQSGFWLWEKQPLRNGACFPAAAQAYACMDDGGAIINARSIRERSMTIIPAAALPSLLLTTQMAAEVTSLLSVRICR